MNYIFSERLSINIHFYFQRIDRHSKFVLRFSPMLYKIILKKQNIFYSSSVRTRIAIQYCIHVIDFSIPIKQ